MTESPAAGRPPECVVVGAGPAGLSAALWLHKLGVASVVLERRGDLGGELEQINLPVRDYLGLGAANGRAFMEAVRASLAAAAITVRLGSAVEAVDARRREVRLAGGTLAAPTLILATGVRRRTLPLPAVAALVGRGVTYSATRDLALLRDQPVAVVGGGDGALENALILATVCPRVVVVHRRAELRARAEFVARAQAEPRIEVLLESQVTDLEPGGTALAGLTVATPAGARRLEVRWLLVKCGFVPNTELLGGSVALDPQGYVEVDRRLRTSAPGVFAAGDVADPLAPCIATAVGDGAMAARGVAELLR